MATSSRSNKQAKRKAPVIKPTVKVKGATKKAVAKGLTGAGAKARASQGTADAHATEHAAARGRTATLGRQNAGYKGQRALKKK